MSNEVTSPFTVFFDRSGQPLDNGYIYIGTAGINPEVSPITVYWDEALTIPAAQPIRTLAGYPSRDGSPGTLIINQTSYSIVVRDKTGALVYSDLNVVNTAIPWRTPLNLIIDSNTDEARAANSSSLQTCVNIGPGRIVLPVGTIYYNDFIDLTAAERIIIEGAGQGTILLSVTTGGIGIRIGDGTDNPRLMVLRDFQVGFTTSQSTNAFFDLDNANEVRIQRIGLISNAKTWFRIAGGAAQYNTWIEGCTPYGGANYAFLIDNAQGVVIKDVLGASLTEGGITFVECSGCYMQDVDMAGTVGNAFSTFPGAGQVVKAVFAARCFGDTSTGYGWFISTNGGDVSDINLTQCWGASCTEDGILIDGGTGTINGVQVLGFKATNNQKRGIRVERASNVIIDSPSCTSNSQAGSAIYDGIAIGANAVDVTITGGFSGSGGTFATNLQRYGISNAGTNTFVDPDIDLSGNVTGTFLDSGTSTKDNVISATLWGVVVGTTGAAAANVAAYGRIMTRAAALGRAKIINPPGQIYINAEIAITGANVSFDGGGASTTILVQNTLNAKILNITGANCAVSNVGLIYNGTPTSGATALYWAGASGETQSVTIFNAFKGVEIVLAGSGQHFNLFKVFSYEDVAFHANGATDIYIDNFEFNAGSTSLGDTAGFLLSDKAEALFASNGSVFTGKRPIKTEAASYTQDNRPAYCTFTAVFFDAFAENAIISQCVEMDFIGCWFSGGRTSGGFDGCIVSTADSIRFTNCRFFNCGYNGALVAATALRTVFINCSFESNGITVGGTAARGIEFAANTTDFIVMGCKAHNGLYTGTQGYGIVVGVGTSDRYIVADNLVTGNATGGVFDGGTGVNKRVANNY